VQRSSGLRFQFFSVEAFLLFPKRQSNGSDLPCQREARHLGLHAFVQQSHIEVAQRPHPTAGPGRGPLEDLFHLVIVIRKRSVCTVLTGDLTSPFATGSVRVFSRGINLVSVDFFCPCALDSLVEPAERLQRVAEIELQRGVLRAQVGSAANEGGRFFVLALLMAQHAEQVQRVDVRGIEIEGGAIAALGVVEPAVTMRAIRAVENWMHDAGEGVMPKNAHFPILGACVPT